MKNVSVITSPTTRSYQQLQNHHHQPVGGAIVETCPLKGTCLTKKICLQSRHHRRKHWEQEMLYRHYSYNFERTLQEP